MDTVDLYQIHRWDPETPIEVTFGAHIELAPTCLTVPRRTASSSAPKVTSIGVSGSQRWI